MADKKNPYGVTVKSKWRSKDPRRQNKFTVLEIKKGFAIVDYGFCQREINLLRFGNYKQVK